MKNYHNLFKFALLFLVLLLFWVILASRIDSSTVFIGIIISITLVFYNRNAIFDANKKISLSPKHFFTFLHYLLRLFVDILKANIDVALIVLNPKLPINPSVITIRTSLKSDALKVLFSNSITLTPGTLTLVNDDNKIVVHCLTEEAKQGVINWDMEKIIAKFEEDK